MPRKAFANVRGKSSSTAPKPDLPKDYKPAKGYKPGGTYDPVVAAQERAKRAAPSRARRPTDWDSPQQLRAYKPDARKSAQGAMIRTNTHVPAVAVAREKVQELRKRKGARSGGKA